MSSILCLPNCLTGAAHETVKDFWIRHRNITFAISIIMMVGACAFYAACLIHHPASSTDQSHFFMGESITSLLFLAGSIVCHYISEGKITLSPKTQG